MSIDSTVCVPEECSMSSEPSAKKAKTSEDKFLSGLAIYLHPAALSKTRKAIFERQVGAKGGRLVSDLTKEDTPIVLIDDCLIDETRMGLLVDKIANSGAEFVGLRWLSDCLKEGKLLSRSNYQLSQSPTPSCLQDGDKPPRPSKPPPLLQDNFVCSK